MSYILFIIRIRRVQMILNAIFFSIFIPLSVQSLNDRPLMIGKPYLVKAVVDSACIIGLPSSRAAKDYAQRRQMLDPSIQFFYTLSEPVSWRMLFFREYFT